jgi:hypothetical protein
MIYKNEGTWILKAWEENSPEEKSDDNFEAEA